MKIINGKVSIGLAFSRKGKASFEVFYRNADNALYLAMNSGKNQVRTYIIDEEIKRMNRMLQHDIERGEWIKI